MAVDAVKINQTVQQFLQADKAAADAQSHIADAQASYAHLTQTREAARQALIAALNDTASAP